MNFGVGDRGGCGLFGHVWLAFDLSMPHLLRLSTDFILPFRCCGVCFSLSDMSSRTPVRLLWRFQLLCLCL